MSDVVIRVENLCKEYHLGTLSHGTLYRDLQSGWAKLRGKEDPNARIGAVNREQLNNTNDRFSALKDVSFDVRQGEIVGIIGRNGAGKSTLLKIISRVTAPTSGTIKIKGRVASLLEVGTGFHPELNGRENIFLNGAILGMHKGEIEQKFDEIVRFAEIDLFIDTPVKRYSSGMYVRLAFAVAAHLDPEILVVDEVLAVGDAGFQKKCLGKMGEISKEGRTVLFVSHNTTMITHLCSRCIWLNDGKLVEDSTPKKVVSDYLDQLQKGFGIEKRKSNDKFIIEKILLKNQKGEITSEYLFGDDLIVEIFFYTQEKIIKPNFAVAIVSQFGSLFGAHMILDDCSPEYIEKEGRITCIFHKLPLLPRQYSIIFEVFDQKIQTHILTTDIGLFNVVGSMKDIGFHGDRAEFYGGRSSPVVIPYEWKFPDIERFSDGNTDETQTIGCE